MEVDFCSESLKIALQRGRPEIFNSDQGPQFTSGKFTSELEAKSIDVGIALSNSCADGWARALFRQQLY